MDTETLKITKDKAEQRAKMVEWRVVASTKAAIDVEEALKRAMEDNSIIKGSQEAQVLRIREMEALLEKSEARSMAVEKKIVKAKTSTKDQIKAATTKVVEAFRALKEFCDEKVQFATNTYVTGQQIIWNRLLPSIQS